MMHLVSVLSMEMSCSGNGRIDLLAICCRGIMMETLLLRAQPNSILVTWEHYRLNILARREEINDPNILSDFEYCVRVFYHLWACTLF
jgi:hypothetical protein